ncbi:MAG TPA: tellurite resistance/C4-dicarboxylate transporter family protein [Jiangellales bacterium]|nr:tellurite resistance/C4-dicarboxylate transporter family protein [Jiangellales bacterium]
MTVRDLYPGYFALVMATGICSTALLDVGLGRASAALLVVAVVAFVLLFAALTWRAIRYRQQLLADLGAPEKAYAFFTFTAACNVLAARILADGYRTVAIALAIVGGLAWLVLSYTIPVRLILGPRPRPVLAGVNGTWFIWVVGTQSMAVTWAMLDQPGGAPARIAPLVAVLLWSVGVVLYLVVATLVLTRLLLVEVKPEDLTPPYWVTMGATAITVLAAAKILGMVPSPPVAATTAVVQGLAVVLWAFGTWLIPLLVAFGVWRHVLHRIRLEYVPTLWSIVFPLGMYAVASMELGSVAHLPIVAGIGRIWTGVALAAWLAVFVGLCITPLKAMMSRPNRPQWRSPQRSRGLPQKSADLPLLASGEVGDAQVGFGERLQTFGIDGRVDRA